MTSIPSFFVMQATSGGPYLGINPDMSRRDDPEKRRVYLDFGEDDIFSPRAKFVVKQSKTGDDKLVHIRSCFNNKYWVPYPDSTKTYKVVAAANKPQEEKRDSTCTLFRVSADYTSDGTPGFQFFSMGTSQLVDYIGFQLKLQDDQDQDHTDVQYTFPVVNWEDLVILPSQVSFKSQVLDGNYLGSGLTKGVNYHKFVPGFDIGNPQVGYELVPDANGNYRIKSLNFGKYWRGGSEWVVADAEDNNNSDDTMFSFIKISDNVVALRNLGTNKFCGARQGDNFLRTDYSDITNDTRITVEERVMKRKISHVRYRLGDSKIHDEVVQEVSSEVTTNDSPDKEAEATLKSSQTRSVTTTWNNSESLSFGTSVNVGFEVSEVPVVVTSTFQVELSTEYGSTHEWGESTTTQTQTEASYTIKVPPKSTIKIWLMVYKGACDVPFNYKETVLLSNGKWVTKERDDGIFKGVNTLTYEYFSEKLDYQPGHGKIVG